MLILLVGNTGVRPNNIHVQAFLSVNDDLSGKTVQFAAGMGTTIDHISVHALSDFQSFQLPYMVVTFKYSETPK